MKLLTHKSYKPELRFAKQFTGNLDGWNNTIFWSAQHECHLHREGGGDRINYREIKIGEWVVRFPSGKAISYTDGDFRKSLTPVDGRETERDACGFSPYWQNIPAPLTVQGFQFLPDAGASDPRVTRWTEKPQIGRPYTERDIYLLDRKNDELLINQDCRFRHVKVGDWLVWPASLVYLADVTPSILTDENVREYYTVRDNLTA